MDPTLLGVLITSAASTLGTAAMWLVRRRESSLKALDRTIRATFEQVMETSGSRDKDVNRQLFLMLFDAGWAHVTGKGSEAAHRRAAAMFDVLWKHAENQEETRAREALAGAGKRAEKFAAYLDELARKSKAEVGTDGLMHREYGGKP